MYLQKAKTLVDAGADPPFPGEEGTSPHRRASLHMYRTEAGSDERRDAIRIRLVLTGCDVFDADRPIKDHAFFESL